MDKTKIACALYRTFVTSTVAPMHILPWNDLPPITQGAWVDVVIKAMELLHDPKG